MSSRKVTKFEDMPTLGGWRAVTWDNRTLADRMAQEAQKAQQDADAGERQRRQTVLERWQDYVATHPRDQNGAPREYDPMTPAEWFR